MENAELALLFHPTQTHPRAYTDCDKIDYQMLPSTCTHYIVNSC